jgi:hypothetical protein
VSAPGPDRYLATSHRVTAFVVSCGGRSDGDDLGLNDNAEIIGREVMSVVGGNADFVDAHAEVRK